MTTHLLLKLYYISLSSEPFLNGIITPATRRSFLAKIRAINAQQTIQTNFLLHAQTDGNHVIIVNTTDPLPPYPSDNTIFLAILELLTSLEEDAIKILDGDLTPTTHQSYKTTNHNIRLQQNQLLVALGIATELDNTPTTPQDNDQ